MTGDGRTITLTAGQVRQLQESVGYAWAHRFLAEDRRTDAIEDLRELLQAIAQIERGWRMRVAYSAGHPIGSELVAAIDEALLDAEPELHEHDTRLDANARHRIAEIALDAITGYHYGITHDRVPGGCSCGWQGTDADHYLHVIVRRRAQEIDVLVDYEALGRELLERLEELLTDPDWAARYTVAKERAAADTDTLIGYLRDRGLLTEKPSSVSDDPLCGSPSVVAGASRAGGLEHETNRPPGLQPGGALIDSNHWLNALATHDRSRPPGALLPMLLPAVGLTFDAAIAKMDMPFDVFEGIVRGDEPITVERAHQLARLNLLDANVWLRLERQHRAALIERLSAEHH